MCRCNPLARDHGKQGTRARCLVWPGGQCSVALLLARLAASHAETLEAPQSTLHAAGCAEPALLLPPQLQPAVAACIALWLLMRRRRQARQRGAAAAEADGSSSSSHLGSKAPEAEGGRLPRAAQASRLSVEELKDLQARQRSEQRSAAVPLPGRCGSLDGSAQGAALQPDGTLGVLSGGTSLQALARQVSAASGRSWGSSGTVDIKPWVLHFLELELHKRIGSGSYGAVFLAHWHQVSGSGMASCNCSGPAHFVRFVRCSCIWSDLHSRQVSTRR